MNENLRLLKVLSVELDIVILVLVQLDQKLEHRSTKVPQLRDLRGFHDYYADSILFLYREDVYQQDSLQDNGLVQIIIAKHRFSFNHTIFARFDKERAVFRDLSPYHKSDVGNTDILP